MIQKALEGPRSFLHRVHTSPGFIVRDSMKRVSGCDARSDGMSPLSSAGLGKNKWKVPSPTVVLFHKSLGEEGGGAKLKKSD